MTESRNGTMTVSTAPRRAQRNSSAPGYEHAGFFMLRAPALPVDQWTALTRPSPTELCGVEDSSVDPLVAHTRTQLRALVGTDDVQHALTAAGSSLVDGLSRLGETVQPAIGSAGKEAEKRVGRIYGGALRYVTRMSTRPTPFGVFSGIGLGEFADRTTARLGAEALAEQRVRPDMGWLLALIKKVEEDPTLLPELRVVVNTLAYPAGERLVLPCSDVYGQEDRRAARVRASTALSAVLELASTPLPYRSLMAGLNERFPEVELSQVEAFLRELVGLNFLISDLRPPVTLARPEEHVLERLAEVPAASTLVMRLREVSLLGKKMTRGNTAALRELRAKQRELVAGQDRQPFQLDARLDLPEKCLNERVAIEVADAVGCLSMLSQAAGGDYPHLAQYHSAFLERYGTDVMVPILEVLSPEGGLDAPEGYTRPPRAFPLPDVPQPDGSARSRVLMALAARAWRNGDSEVELTDDLLTELTADAADTGRTLPAAPAIDAYVQLQAADPSSLDAGRWRAVLNTDGLAMGGRTFGRFFDLLGADGVTKLREYALAREALEPDVVHAEVAYLPPDGRSGNVTIRPGLHRYEIPVNVTPSAEANDVINLSDVFVYATDEGLRLYSARLGRELVAVQNHMLAPFAAPNVCRFMLEVSQSRWSSPAGFDWGPVEGAPFLPRVARGKVVLRPAEWTLPPAAPDRANPRSLHTTQDVARWRADWAVPRHVYLADHDNRLLLDLDHPLCVKELLSELRSATGTVSIQEMLPGLEELWLRDEDGRGYLSEVVIPLITRAAAVRPALEQVPARLMVSTEPATDRHLPGSRWSFLKLYAAKDVHDEIVVNHLRKFVTELRTTGEADRWFYIRYADTMPHLRIRIRAGSDQGAGRVLTRLMEWGKDLVERGIASDLQVAAYHPEIGRYGGPAAFDPIERLFEAGSDLSSELLSMLWHKSIDADPDLVTIAAVDALYAQWGLDVPQRLAATHTPLEDLAARDRYRAQRDYLCTLLQPESRRPHARGRAHHDLLAPVFARHAAAAARAASAVAEAEAAGVLRGSRDSILSSLAHMQVNRLMPIDRAAEERCYLVWRQTLRCLRGRPA